MDKEKELPSIEEFFDWYAKEKIGYDTWFRFTRKEAGDVVMEFTHKAGH